MAAVGKEYAEALFSLALENDSVDEFFDAIDLIKELFEEYHEYIDFLSTPSIPKEERLARLEECFVGMFPEMMLHFLSVMLKRGDIRSFSDSAAEFESLCFASKSISNAVVTSAVALTEAEKSRLSAKLETLCGHTVRLHCKVDSSLIGGMIVEIDGRIIDGSLKHRMRELKGIISE